MRSLVYVWVSSSHRMCQEGWYKLLYLVSMIWRSHWNTFMSWSYKIHQNQLCPSHHCQSRKTPSTIIYTLSCLSTSLIIPSSSSSEKSSSISFRIPLEVFYLGIGNGNDTIYLTFKVFCIHLTLKVNTLMKPSPSSSNNLKNVDMNH